MVYSKYSNMYPPIKKTHIRRTSLADVGNSLSIFGRRCSSSKSRQSVLVTTITDSKVPASLLQHCISTKVNQYYYGKAIKVITSSMFYTKFHGEQNLFHKVYHKTDISQVLQFLWIECSVVLLYQRQQHPVQRQAGTRVERQHQFSNFHWLQVKNTPTRRMFSEIQQTMSLCVVKMIYSTLMYVNILHSGKLSREKTFANFEV